MKIIGSFPKLDKNLLEELENTLSEKFNLPPLPNDYIDFLLQSNGGFVTPGYIQNTNEGIKKEEVVFTSPLKEDEDNWTPSIFAFFGGWTSEPIPKPTIEGHTVPNLIAAYAYLKFEYDFLPDKMMPIATCTLPDAGDLLCIGLDERDYGSVYFFFSQWFNPAFTADEDYYELKTNKILKKHKLVSIHDSAISEEAKFEIDRIPFIKVANSLSEFLNNLRIKVV